MSQYKNSLERILCEAQILNALKVKQESGIVMVPLAHVYTVYRCNARLEKLGVEHVGINRDLAESRMLKAFLDSRKQSDYYMDSQAGVLAYCFSERTKILRSEQPE